MKDPHDPVRWDASESDASDELRRALAALADAERPQVDELQRVRERLLTVFEAPAPRRVRLMHALGGSMGVLAIGLALIGGLVAWFRFERSGLESLPQSVAGRAAEELSRPGPAAEGNAADPGRSAPSEHAVAGLNVAGIGEASVREAATRGPAPRSLERDDGANTRVASPAPARGVRRRDVGTARPRASEASANAHVDDGSVERASAVSAAPRVDDTSVTASGDSPAERAALRPSESGPRVAVRDVPTDGPRQPAADGGQAVLLDEATLLQRARRLSSSDPAQALRVLDEHKRRFSAGMLSPEREVLAIELLRSLSRTQEAERRAHEFRRDYPKSVYLSRIQP